VAKRATKKTAKKKKKKTDKRTSKCGKCGGAGHNARSCSADGVAVLDDEIGTVEVVDDAEPIEPPGPSEVEEAEEAEEGLTTTSIDAGPPPSTKRKAKEQTPEDVFELDTVRASELVKDQEPAGREEPPPVDHSIPAPGLKLTTPKKKKKRSKAELAFWSATEKKLAPGALAEAGNLSLDIPRISSGNFGIDVGLYGGLPQGRFIRITGLPKASKTGFCLNTVSQYQLHHCSECFGPKALCKCDSDVPDVLWIDIEHRLASMLRWVKGHGVNLECMRIMGPPTGQNVVDLVDHVIRSAPQAKTGLIVLDSIAHITSQDEIKKATLDGITIGRNAMLMNAAWRKWTSAFHSLGIDNPYKPTVLAINQIRHKVGQNYGCFHKDTPVMFADGSQVPIREVVEKRLEGPVLSWDGSKVVEHKIIGWHDNGLLNDDEEWLTFRVRGTGGRRGAMGFTCTPNHVLVNGDGFEVSAADVRVGDKLMSWYEHREHARGDQIAEVSLEKNRVLIATEVVKVHKSKRKALARRKYDLAIEEDSFYLVGGDSRGVVVHNSPETMPGGMGQGYASTVDIRFSAGAPSFVIYDEKKEKFIVKQKAYKSTFKPQPDQTPDFITVNWRVTASGHCPPGRSGEFNYWLKSAHGHRCGDPDNGLQLWEYCKRYDLIEVEGHAKRLFGNEARTFDELRELFRADPKAQRKAWVKLMGLLSDDD